LKSPELEHAAKIERLLSLNPKDIEKAKIKGLIDAVLNKELTEEDVLQFTNISAEQLEIMLNHSSVNGDG